MGTFLTGPLASLHAGPAPNGGIGSRCLAPPANHHAIPVNASLCRRAGMAGSCMTATFGLVPAAPRRHD